MIASLLDEGAWITVGALFAIAANVAASTVVDAAFDDGRGRSTSVGRPWIVRRSPPRAAGLTSSVGLSIVLAVSAVVVWPWASRWTSSDVGDVVAWALAGSAVWCGLVVLLERDGRVVPWIARASIDAGTVVAFAVCAAALA